MKRLLALVCLLGACDDANTPRAALRTVDLAGEYRDPFGTYHLISAERWLWGEAADPQVFEIVDFDNDAHWILARNSPDNREAPARFSRFDWQIDPQLRYCHTVTNATTVEAAATASPEQCAPGDWISLRSVAQERVPESP